PGRSPRGRRAATGCCDGCRDRGGKSRRNRSERTASWGRASGGEPPPWAPLRSAPDHALQRAQVGAGRVRRLGASELAQRPRAVARAHEQLGALAAQRRQDGSLRRVGVQLDRLREDGGAVARVVVLAQAACALHVLEEPEVPVGIAALLQKQRAGLLERGGQPTVLRRLVDALADRGAL